MRMKLGPSYTGDVLEEGAEENIWTEEDYVMGGWRYFHNR
jgi:hypothetical protein